MDHLPFPKPVLYFPKLLCSYWTSLLISCLLIFIVCLLSAKSRNSSWVTQRDLKLAVCYGEIMYPVPLIILHVEILESSLVNHFPLKTKWPLLVYCFTTDQSRNMVPKREQGEHGENSDIKKCQKENHHDPVVSVELISASQVYPSTIKTAQRLYRS